MGGKIYEVTPSSASSATTNDMNSTKAVLGFVNRVAGAKSLQALYFMLTNDLRSIIEFDRCALIAHLGGLSKLVAINNQPLLDKKAQLHSDLNRLAVSLKAVQQGIFIPMNFDWGQDNVGRIPPDAAQAIRLYMSSSGCSHLFIAPLIWKAQAVGHLVIEFFQEAVPTRTSMEILTKIAPVLATELSQQWLLEKRSWLQRFALTGSRFESAKARIAKYVIPIVIALTLGGVILFVVPFSDVVGGAVEIIPKNRHFAFCKTEGLIDKIFVREDDQVRSDQLLAVIDPKETDFKIHKAQTDFDILTQQMVILRSVSDQDPGKLAESKLVELKRKAAWAELNFYKWQRGFLEVKAPADGRIVTKDVDSLVGKKFNTGESFCEIGVASDLWARDCRS